MEVHIPHDLFMKGHQLFLDFIKEKSGQEFDDFEHNEYLFKEEIGYKDNAWRDARRIMQIEKWEKLRKTPGKIIDKLNEACDQKIHTNLLHVFPKEGRSAKALDQARTREEKRRGD